jgi:hypothetical protein
VAVAVNWTLTVHVGLHGLLKKNTVTPEGRTEVTENVTGVVVPVVRVAVIADCELVEP